MASRKKITTIGFDVFVQNEKIPQVPEQLPSFKLKLISNRGTKVWPGTPPPIHLTDLFCCRYLAETAISSTLVTQALAELDANGISWVHVEKLIQLDGKNAFSDAQGE
jgi:hypothetical protein